MSTAAAIAAAGLERLDNRPTDVLDGAILCFAFFRDEVLRLPYFLDYHRALGVGRFFVIDNSSTDGTTPLLLAQRDVHVFAAPGSYAASLCGVTWLNALLAAYAIGHWALTLDADELLVYPACETLPLRAFTAHLARAGANALSGFLLDMYGAGPIRTAHYQPGAPFLATCPFFDADTNHERTPEGLPARGGPRCGCMARRKIISRNAGGGRRFTSRPTTGRFATRVLARRRAEMRRPPIRAATIRRGRCWARRSSRG